MRISIVVPCYNEEKTLHYFYKEILKVITIMKNYTFEIIFIDDGSNDGTLNIIKELKKNNNKIRYIAFSRNFGKEAALYAGLKKSTGEYVVIMDADLQDPPSLLPKMMEYIKEGYDSVATRRVTRKGEPIIRSFFARLFYKLMNKITDIDIVDGARDYRLMNRIMVNAILSMSEYNRFSKGIFGWIGFRTKWVEYENVERIAGETKWNFIKLFKYSIEGIVAFSVIPLQIASIFGVLLSFLSFIAVLFILFRTIMYSDPVAGWPSLICVITFIGGIQLLCIGILGNYLAKTYLETKKRPLYIVRESSC